MGIGFIAVVGLFCFCSCTKRVAVHERPPAQRNKKAGMELQTVQGYKMDRRCLLEMRGRVKAGLRFRENASAAYLEIERIGPVRRIILGNFKLLLGNGLLFGEGARFFYMQRSKKLSRRLFKSAPTLSLWNRQKGALVSLRWSSLDANLAVIEKAQYPKGDPLPRALFASILTRWPSGALGWGALWHVRQDRPGDGSAGYGLRPVYQGVCVLEMSGVGLSAELDLAGSRAFGSLRIVLPEPVFVNLRIFKAPDKRAVGDWVEVSRCAGSIFQGTVVHVEHRKLRYRPRLFLSATVSLRASRTIKARNLSFALSGGRRKLLKWSFETSFDEQVTWEHHSGALPGLSPAVIERDIRLRVSANLREGRFSHLLRADLWADPLHDKPVGALLCIGISWKEGRLGISFKATGYSIGPARWALVSRPGVGPFENFSLVRARGTDISARVKFEPVDGLRFAAYCGFPKLGERRLYAGIRYRY